MNESNDKRTLGEMGLLEHLAELRQRLIYSFIAILAGAAIAYAFSTKTFEILSAPYFGAFPSYPLIGTGPAEAFVVRLKVALFVGAILASPILFAQVWLFISPGLLDHEKKMFVPFVAASCFLFLLGITLCYEGVLPLAFKFFAEQYKEIGLTPTVKMSEHLSMMVTTLIGFGIVFELPVLAYFLGRVGIIDHHTLIGGFRYAVVIIFIISAVLTPPDVLSQFLMATPLIMLYGVSILVVKYTSRGKNS
jgi:sec-independent protein translocase protein TatC